MEYNLTQLPHVQDKISVFFTHPLDFLGFMSYFTKKYIILFL